MNKKQLFVQLQKGLCEWDPMDLVSLTTSNEYNIECEAIVSKIHADMGVFEVATIIRNTLVASFGTLLPATKTEIENTGYLREADGEFSRRCISLARDIRISV